MTYNGAMYKPSFPPWQWHCFDLTEHRDAPGAYDWCCKNFGRFLDGGPDRRWVVDYYKTIDHTELRCMFCFKNADDAMCFQMTWF
jgi:hypothetical protein